MTTLFDSSTIVKPSTFGRGLLRSLPHSTAPFTAADAAWAALAFSGTAEDAEYDRRADEAAMLDRYSRGYCL